ncbi:MULTISPECIES: hypothetical protein [Nonlabens]|uniref:Uncharacterized protein n=2 Tax=Nonlabens TaxID=363408 RepID=A0A090W9D1_NONUL|nr:MULTISPECIES: hypothetical protein [Nonlabens]PQJ31246.1 hypothetical protein BST92_04590 [Nonlabens arenilitoris]WOI22120.1 hypothetical protein R1T42_10625 [Nonlabens ulvanivorans]GAL02002.1 hypothetical protein JCM19314_3744 [Nonlabens ulvanivorans]GAL73620.1 hypothetical protein JCM19275_2467 [Nonlabens ulvanivorans]
MKIISILLIGVIITLIIGFYNLYNGGDYALAQKTIGAAVMTLFFIVMPGFLIVRYKDKKLKSFIWNPDALRNDEEE